MPKYKRIPGEKFTQEIDKLLYNYGLSVDKDLSELSKQFAKRGAKEVGNRAREMFGAGDYSHGWQSQFEEGRYSAQGIIYNAYVPGLPHLLEKGHAKRGGGRVPGRAHIAPVEEKLVIEFRKAVEKSI